MLGRPDRRAVIPATPNQSSSRPGAVAYISGTCQAQEAGGHHRQPRPIGPPPAIIRSSMSANPR